MRFAPGFLVFLRVGRLAFRRRRRRVAVFRGLRFLAPEAADRHHAHHHFPLLPRLFLQGRPPRRKLRFLLPPVLGLGRQALLY